MSSIAELREFAMARSLGRKTDLGSAIQALGYVQADPIRAPARAQDLILMQRVKRYKVGDLELHYPTLGIEEEVLHNYGFVPREIQKLVHPRPVDSLKIERDAPGLAEQILLYLNERESVHPRDLDAYFGRSAVTNAWGGKSNLTTRVLDALHYRGKLRVMRRENGIRVYGIANHSSTLTSEMSREDQARGLVKLLLTQYAPIPVQSLSGLIGLLAYGAPHLKMELRIALKTIETQRVKVDGLVYLWPEGETFTETVKRQVRLLSPFDPVVWDRRRFEHLHGWAYKFEAYTPAPKRKFGYYALPLLWGSEAIGWANLKAENGDLKTEIGFINGAPKSKVFARELEAELERYRAFLGVPLSDRC